MTTGAGNRRRRGLRPAALQRWSLLECALNAVAWLSAMAWAADGVQRLSVGGDGSVGVGLLILLWPLVPSVVMAGVVLLAYRVPQLGPPLAAASVGLVLVITAASLVAIFTSESSTAALGFVTLPLVEVGVAVLAALACLALAALPSPSMPR